MLGQNTAPAIFSVTTNTNYSSSDYNGFRPNPGAEVSFQWNVGPTARGRAPAPLRRFATLEAYAQATRPGSAQRHARLRRLHEGAEARRDPKTVQRLYDVKDLDFRLRPGSAAIDRGVALPNITDGFTGKAPDLGALEAGQPLPIYGPRR